MVTENERIISALSGVKRLVAMDTDAHTDAQLLQQSFINDRKAQQTERRIHEPFLSSRLRANQTFETSGDLSKAALDIFTTAAKQWPEAGVTATSGQGLSKQMSKLSTELEINKYWTYILLEYRHAVLLHTRSILQ